MKIKVNKEAIIDCLQKVQAVINPRNALPVLSNVLFKAENGKLELTATDMALTVRATMDADVAEPGTTTLPAKRIFGVFRELSVDEAERVALLDGRRVELTAQEFALLLALMEKPDIPVSREQLLRQAWGYQSMGETRTVDVHIAQIRKKLGLEEQIKTISKMGYRLED